ncbi:hypothetical protein BMQ_pBM20002 (plasmid) [Priestia megaterium QM B1551]|uniref:Uncharacterized protein n=1 Tax=Priestia megaterium (strain ATCC 12872 / QMB1551) TaxID=545693 RepID=D5E388_PRIM1|nr:hypothetical protein BMQ_pBM20002 [Priestia megaterium QM B1551]
MNPSRSVTLPNGFAVVKKQKNSLPPGSFSVFLDVYYIYV